ncbi:MAG: hypothetical protein II480_00595 [Bacteroidales bacterium]|nr:hypothetical protein [Bacteroidales bacterium]
MNKKNLWSLLATLLMALPLLMTSCGDDDPIEDEPVNNVTPKPDDKPENKPDDKPSYTPISEPLEKSEYTIIYYGHGGGDLDASILNNINDLFLADKNSYNKVHAAVQYKFSSKEGLTTESEDEEEDFEDDFDAEKYGHATLRFVVDPSADFEEMLDDISPIALADKDLDIAATESLTNFIKWAVQYAPANKYILVLSDHGGGYSPEDELPMDNPTLSKGLVYDDGANFDHITAEKIVKAVNAAGIRPEVIYLDACLMNTIEYQYELKDIANYLILSTFSVPGPGGDYVSLIDGLAKNNIETALSDFSKATVKRWDEEIDEENNEKAYPYSDISVIRTANLDAFGNKWKDFTDQLISAYESGDEGVKEAIDEVTAAMMAMECAYPLYDMNFYAEQIIAAVPDYFDESLSQDLADAYDNYIVCRKASKELEKYGYKIGTSILFGCNNHFTSYSWAEDEETGEHYLDGYVTYEADGTMNFYENDGTKYDEDIWNGNFDITYKRLKFDQLTHWSDWIAINTQEASAYSPAGLFYEITEEGFVEPVVEEEEE